MRKLVLMIAAFSLMIAGSAAGASVAAASKGASASSKNASAALTGKRGKRGKRGRRGPRGLRGPAGPAGPRGPGGIPGVAGPAGPQGIPGTAAAQGAPGADGADGADGATGPQGPSATQINYRVAVNTGSQSLYAGHGVSLRAACSGSAAAPSLTVDADGTQDDGIFQGELFGPGSTVALIGPADGDLDNGDTASLIPATSGNTLRGLLVNYAGRDNTATTVNALARAKTSAATPTQGSCSVVGTVIVAS